MLSAKKIPAGKRGQIEALVQTDGLTGPVEKSIMIATNDPRNANVTLTIKAVVEPEIGMSDSQIVFDEVPAGREVAKEVILKVRDGRSTRVLSAYSREPSILAKLEAVPGSGGRQWKLIAVRKANAKPGYFFGQIVVKTDSRLTPEFPIYVRGTTTPAKKQ